MSLTLVTFLVVTVPWFLSDTVKPSVYVVADRDVLERLSSREAKELADSVRDLREQVGKRANITLAPDARSADILVTLHNRRIEFQQSRQSYGGADVQTQYQSRYIISYRLTVGETTREGEYYLDGSLVTWKRLASGLAREIEAWAKAHPELTSEKTRR